MKRMMNNTTVWGEKEEDHTIVQEGVSLAYNHKDIHQL